MAQSTLQGTAQELLIIAREIAPLMHNGLNASELSQIADRRSAVSNLGPSARTYFIQVATDWLQFCGKYHERPQRPLPYVPLLQEYAKYQLEECGLALRSMWIFPHRTTDGRSMALCGNRTQYALPQSGFADIIPVYLKVSLSLKTHGIGL